MIAIIFLLGGGQLFLTLLFCDGSLLRLLLFESSVYGLDLFLKCSPIFHRLW